MDNRDNGSTENQLHQDYSDAFTTLEASVRVAIEFAEQWNEPYRPYIFQATLTRLEKDESATLGRTLGSASHTLEENTSTDSDMPLSKLAWAVSVDLDLLRRVIQIDDGVIEIIGRLENDSDPVKEQQNKYSVVYAFLEKRLSAIDPLALRTYELFARSTDAMTPQILHTTSVKMCAYAKEKERARLNSILLPDRGLKKQPS